jgi:putative ABC transport system permease protein
MKHIQSEAHPAMKFLPLLWAGIWRKPARAMLMLLQIVSAFTLFGLLEGVNSSVKKVIADAHGDRLYVGSSVSLRDPLPISMMERIRAVPGVRHVTPRVILGGTYQQANQPLFVVGLDIAEHFAVLEEMIVSKEAIAAAKARRSGVLVGRLTMEKYGLKIGDRLVLQSPLPRRDGSRRWEFDIVGTFDITVRPREATLVFANYEYLDESRLINRGTSDMYVVKIDDAGDSGTVGLAIDNLFANSPHETRTQSEADLATAQIQRVADLDYIVTGIIAAVFFALLFATGAMMMQSVRERVPELAVLKTLGFSDARVMGLLLTEAVVFCVSSAVVGLLAAKLLMPLARSVTSQAALSSTVVTAGLAFAVMLALLGGSLPAWRGMRLQVVDALAGR